MNTQIQITVLLILITTFGGYFVNAGCAEEGLCCDETDDDLCQASDNGFACSCNNQCIEEGNCCSDFLEHCNTQGIIKYLYIKVSCDFLAIIYGSNS